MKIGLIGFGNLGKAFIAGLVHAGIAQEDLCITAKTERTLAAARQLYEKAYVVSDKKELVHFSDIIILSVEPKNAGEVFEELNGADLDRKMIVSFMSGINISDIVNALVKCSGNFSVVRAMPNIAISTGKGIAGISYNNAPEKDIDQLVQLLEKLGLVLTVSENELVNITLSASSGMAAVCTLIESYQNEIKNYLSAESAAKITQYVFAGTLPLLQDHTAKELQDAIATKGGVTEAGLKALDEVKIQSELKNFFQAAMDRINRKN